VDDADVAYRVFHALALERAVYYLQETLAHDGRDLRALVVGGQVVAAIERVGLKAGMMDDAWVPPKIEMRDALGLFQFGLAISQVPKHEQASQGVGQPSADRQALTVVKPFQRTLPDVACDRVEIGQGVGADQPVAGLRRNARERGGQIIAVMKYDFLADTYESECIKVVSVWSDFKDHDLPVRPRKRIVYVFDCRDKPERAPLTIDPTGVWCRPEGATFIGGISPAESEDPDCTDFEIDYKLYEDVVWPTLAQRIPAFEALKLVRAWVGHYDYNTLDQNAILGPHPEVGNFYFANGFSGHGLQQSPAVGRAIAELIAYGEYRSLDLRRFGYERVAKNLPILELNVV
jgi:hypothetical protein